MFIIGLLSIPTALIVGTFVEKEYGGNIGGIVALITSIVVAYLVHRYQKKKITNG